MTRDRVWAYVVHALAGVLFAVGALSGMTQPAKVTAFLDFFGDWDPSLAFVMGGAILVYLPLYRITQKRRTPLFASRFLFPTKRDIDGRLLGGAALFGVGWGPAGYCPGPGITSLGSGAPRAFVFVLSMVAGMVLYRLIERAGAKRSSTAAGSVERAS
jgi:hypothetical protein